MSDISRKLSVLFLKACLSLLWNQEDFTDSELVLQQQLKFSQ